MSDPGELELPRGIALAWGVAADPQRGPKREMSVERIVETAVEIADAEGLASVSMAAVASRLGYTPMSLYRYVTAKDDLVLLMQEEATGLPPERGLAADWRSRLEELYGAQVQLYVRHPWVLDVPITGSPVTPNSAAWMDAGLDALEETPLSPGERLSVILGLSGHARWCGSVLAGYARRMRETGAGDAEVTAQEDGLYRSLISADAYPSLRAAIDAGVFLDDADPFAFGFARFLDGVAAYVSGLDAGGEHEPGTPWVTDPDSRLAADKRFREAQKGVRTAERALRDARRHARQTAREAAERLGRSHGAE